MRITYALALLLTCSCAVTTEGPPAGLRRAVLRSAQVPAPGEIVADVGFAVDPGDRKQVPINLEFGIEGDGALFLDLSAYEKADLSVGDGESVGDMAVGVRQQFWGNDFGRLGALEGRVSFPTGDEDEGVGTGSVDWYVSGMLSQAFEDFEIGGWLELGVLGNAFDSGTDTERTGALTATRNLGDAMLGFVEWQNTFRDDVDPRSLSFGVAWQTSAGSSLDFGVTAGLNDDAPDGAFFFGFRKSLGFFSRAGSRAPSSL